MGKKYMYMYVRELSLYLHVCVHVYAISSGYYDRMCVTPIGRLVTLLTAGVCCGMYYGYTYEIVSIGICMGSYILYIDA